MTQPDTPAPCPFCGGKPEYDNYDHCAGSFIQCTECGARVEGDWDAWNRRPEPAADAMLCAGCEGRPAPENNPCAVCGKSAPAADAVEAVARAIQDAHAPGHPLNHVSIYQARAAIAAMPGQGWQGIESAPSDGSYILTCRMGEAAASFGNELIEGYAEPPEVAQWIDAGDCWMCVQRPHDQWEPTHWRPLPPAPKGE